MMKKVIMVLTLILLLLPGLGCSDDWNREEAVFDSSGIDKELINEDRETLEITFAEDDSATGVREDMELPTIGFWGSLISWESSHPEVVSTEGEVTRPAQGEANIEVTLTATITLGEFTKTREFTITVLAETETFSIQVAVTGLTGTLTLLNKAEDNLIITANGNHIFDGELETGQTYDITVHSSPTGLICVVTGGNGTISGAAVTANVDCYPSGSLDTSFATGGKLQYQPGTNYEASFRDVTVLSDDSLIAVGTYQDTASDNDFIIMKVDANGSVDPDYATGGFFQQDWGTGTDWANHNADSAYSVAIQSDGKIVAAGIAYTGGLDFGLVRLNSDGTTDDDFGTSGAVNTDISGGSSADIARSVRVLPDGGILVAGDSADTDFVLVKYDGSDGSLITEFGTSGIASETIGSAGVVANDMVVLANGDILVVGSADGDVAIVKFDSSGALVSEFGTSGILTLSVSAGNDVANRVSLQDDGSFVVAGGSDGDTVPFLAKYGSDGSLDTSFATSGLMTTDPSGGADYFTGLGVSTSGDIVASGVSSDNWLVCRYSATGSPDLNFATNGCNTFAGTGGTGYSLGGVVFDSQGRIIMAGNFSGANSDFGLARLLP